MRDEPHDPRSYLLAIDPGVNGAWAVLDWTGDYVGCGDLPRFAKTLNAVELGNLVAGYAPTAVIIEAVGPRPEQGSSSGFNFGVAYGVCLGVAGGAGVPVTLVTPQRWKGWFRLVGKSKDASRELAVRLFPRGAHCLNLKRHVDRADALLIARYAFDQDNGAAHP